MQAMESTTVKRFSVKRIGIAAVALGTLAIGLAGASALQDTTQTGSDARPVAVMRSARVDPAARVRFIEWNTQLPSAVAPVRSAAEIAFLEANMLPEAAPVVRTAEDMRFWEANMLPEAAPVVKTAAEIKLWEDNMLPGDGQPFLPPYSQNGATVY